MSEHSNLAPLAFYSLTLTRNISLGKYGHFQSNQIIGRPFYLTFEVWDKVEGTTQSSLRIIPAAELNSAVLDDDISNLEEIGADQTNKIQDAVDYEEIGDDGQAVLQTNRNIADDAKTQTLTMHEIEALKSERTGSGKDLIAKILQSHSALDQKTAFALAKYTLRKAKKYLRRFTVLPLDVSLLSRWLLSEKEPMKIMEMREEMIALIGSWSNLHYNDPDLIPDACEGYHSDKKGRWLVVDETGGLLVAAIAEKLDVLDLRSTSNYDREPDVDRDGESKESASDNCRFEQNTLDGAYRPKKNRLPALLPQSNTITLIHANSQPNLSLLRYFNFDTSNPNPSHPLQTHLKTISWLQLLAPADDNGYVEPELVSDETLRSWKSGRRGNYYRKRRRWERIKSVVDETRSGGFDGLIVASFMSLFTVLHYTVPLLRGAAQVVVYSPSIEPLVTLSDYYSKARRMAFASNPTELGSLPTEDFPVDPTLLLAPTIQTARCKKWQVLPGRTHPLMTTRGGAEGYIFTATRVLPADGKIEARGKFKRRKTDGTNDTMEISSSKTDPVKTPFLAETN